MQNSAEVVICGAGIGGIAAAYMLAVHQGISDVILVDPRSPLTLTSDKSTECYRNWWPGPGTAMVQMMNRSIDLMEAMAHESGNIFHLNQRGYLYVTHDPAQVANLEGFAQEASALGAGEIRRHTPGSHNYTPAQPEGLAAAIGGADLITAPEVIAEHFSYLSEQTVGVLHVRRAGWLSAQQYGMYMLAQARQAGVQLIEDQVVRVELADGQVNAVQLASGKHIETSSFVNAAGPLLGAVGALLGVDLPVHNELHQKASFNDPQGVVGREAPLVIFTDQQILEWTSEEAAMLAEDDETRWLTTQLPSGAHLRPEGGLEAESILLLWDVEDEVVEAQFPPPLDPLYPELALRGMCRMIPGLKTYLAKLPKPFIDGGYYTKTKENRPLAGPMPVAGAYLLGALSGYGIMAAAAMGELLALHVSGNPLPDYAADFTLARYQDPAYQELLANWGDSWQL